MPTVTIGDNTGADHAGTEDTKLRSANPTTNFASVVLEVFSWAVSDDGTTVIRFTGLSNISGPVTVSAAEVRLYQTAHINDPVVIDVHRLLRNWVEAEATADVFSTGNAWQTQLGVGANDISSTVSASLSVGATTGQYYVWSHANLAQDVQDMINGVVLNHGWLFKPDTFAHSTDFCEFTQSEGTDGQRPLLVFTYTAGGGSPNTRHQALLGVGR